MKTSLLAPAVLLLAVSCQVPTADTHDAPALEPAPTDQVQVHYLEIVTPEVAAMCAAYASALGLDFGEPVMEFGGARTADLPNGSRVGIRAPMRADEAPVVRPYWLVEDIDAAVAAAVAGGGEVAMPPMEIPGQGRFAIYLHGGIDHGLWQL